MARRWFEAVRLVLDLEAHRGDESTKDGVARGPAGITFLRFLDGSGLLTVRRTLWVERLENFGKGMEEHAAESLASLVRALDTPDVIVHVQLELERGGGSGVEVGNGTGDRDARRLPR
jgi:hypothetical protein